MSNSWHSKWDLDIFLDMVESESADTFYFYSYALHVTLIYLNLGSDI